jgi:hypothetical protein
MRTLFTLLLLGALSTGAFAQRPRTTEPEPAAKTPSTPSTTTPATPAATRPAPKNVKAKYEGGYFGYNKTMEGTLNFDDVNNRLLFRDGKTPKEISMPYESLTSAFLDTKKVQPGAATVASQVPTIYSLPARFIKTKVHYLTLQYSDPDSHVNGAMSFKIDKDVLESVLKSLAEKAGMVRRGDIYVKKREDDSSKLNP